MSPEYEAVQHNLEQAFSRFRQENPSVAQTIETMNMTFSEYVQLMYGVQPDVQAMTGNAQV